MPSKSSKLIGLSAALAALLPVAAIAPAAAAATDADGITQETGAAPPVVQIPVGDDLMNFIVSEGHGGVVVADHSSHASHSSHSSHSSHYSSR